MDFNDRIRFMAIVTMLAFIGVFAMGCVIVRGGLYLIGFVK